jgi:hypothetical protein
MKRSKQKRIEWRKINKKRNLEAERLLRKLKGDTRIYYTGIIAQDTGSYYAPYIPISNAP